MNYSEMRDNEIIRAYRNGDLDAIDFLIRKYTPLIHKCKSNRFAKGYSDDDFVQEGYIGLMSAINKYDEDAKASFFTYAKICIDNSMNNLIKKSLDNKNHILNNSASLDDEIELPQDIKTDPARIVLSKLINEDKLEEVGKTLSKGESEVYNLLRKGYTTPEIADILEKDYKAVDNAIQRIKSKARRIN